MRYIPAEYQHSFYQQVWLQAREVPYGKVATYGQIAKLLAIPQGLSDTDYREFSARWVGDAMADCPRDVPWQRIVNAQGKVSKRVEANKQRELLEKEGVVFHDDKLSLRNYQWDPKQAESPNQASLF